MLLLVTSQCAVMSLWFSATAVLPQIRAEYALAGWHAAIVTSSVQLGFVAGTLASALLSLADRLEPRRFFVVTALLAAACNLAMVAVPPTGSAFVVLRFVTGACMAGVYPIGIKMIGTWASRDLGLLVGLLVGALTLGSASPHLFSRLGGIDWRIALCAASALAALGALLAMFVQLGSAPLRRSAFSLRNALLPLKDPALRLANLGYLGHMWELYAMWAWIGAFFQASFATRGASAQAADLATFLVIASGALGCALAGAVADRVGRTTITMASMVTSGACALLIGSLFAAPIWLLICVALVWGISVVADSAQFSASIAELADPAIVGTALTVQVCMGFLLTIASIQLVGMLASSWGWRHAFAVLAIGPFLGAWAMYRLRCRPESMRLANGQR